MRTKGENYFTANLIIKHWRNSNVTISKHLIWFQFGCQWCETAGVYSDWGMKWEHVHLGSLLWGKNCTDQGTRWHVSNLALWGWLRKLGVSSGRSPWWWCRISKQLVEVQNDRRKDCVFVTSFPVKPMKINEGWIWVKKPHKCSFFMGIDSTQSTETVRGSISWIKLSWQVIQKKTYVKCQKWEGPRWAGSMMGVQGIISNNSQWKGRQRNSFASRNFTHWFPDPAVCQLNKERKEPTLKWHIWEHCAYWPLHLG